MTSYIRIHDFDPDAFMTFDGSEVVVSDRFVMFWKPPAPFSQWTTSPFEIDGITYNCAEQYMMAEKARLFSDNALEEQILKADSPRQHKKLGKQVAGFSEQRWTAERCNVVFRGNVAKFTQNPELKRHCSKRVIEHWLKPARLIKFGTLGSLPMIRMHTARKNGSGSTCSAMSLLTFEREYGLADGSVDWSGPRADVLKLVTV